jgi:uncharacterized protein YaiI (UPF0178 family)
VTSPSAFRIFVDADACPVKDEVYKVAWRRGVPVKVVSNSPIRVPEHELIERVVVSDAFDAADDWIVEQADAKTVVITGDILLADRCLKTGATVMAPTASRSHPRASAARSRRARSWPICAAAPE